MKKEILKLYDPETRTYSIRLNLTEIELKAVSDLLGVTFRNPNR